jgi:predicted GH43/DUF377 family glycosyl hydrolase
MTHADNPYEVLFHRHSGNPILSRADWPYPINTVFNPGATRLADGTTLLLCRVEDLRGHSHLSAARSRNGVDDWWVDPEPTLLPDPTQYPEEVFGIEDPRITYVPEHEAYYVAYTAFSRYGPGVSLARTKDFHDFERLGAIMPPEDKDAALLPRRIGGQWALIHRPIGPSGAHIWISYSPDLEYWGHQHLMPEGWLMIYHGVRPTASGALYRLGLALFDLEQPERCLLRGDEWVFAPEAAYERTGDVNNVVFPCGHTIGDDGDTLSIYYGAADSSIALATASVRMMLRWLHEHGHAASDGK